MSIVCKILVKPLPIFPNILKHEIRIIHFLFDSSRCLYYNLNQRYRIDLWNLKVCQLASVQQHTDRNEKFKHVLTYIRNGSSPHDKKESFDPNRRIDRATYRRSISFMRSWCSFQAFSASYRLCSYVLATRVLGITRTLIIIWCPIG